MSNPTVWVSEPHDPRWQMLRDALAEDGIVVAPKTRLRIRDEGIEMQWLLGEGGDFQPGDICWKENL